MFTAGNGIRTVGELARETGLTVRTLHHYDEIGLLQPAARTSAGYRLYTEQDVRRVNVIVGLRDLGLPLQQVRRALSGGAEEVQDLLRRQLPEVERQLLTEQRRRERLLAVLATIEHGDDVVIGRLFTGEHLHPRAEPLPAGDLLAGEVVKFGAVYSLTGIGRLCGVPSRNAILLAQDAINESGGVSGALLSVSIEDDESDRTWAARRTRQLIQEEHVLALLGPGISHLAVAAHSVANTLRTPMVASSNPGLHIVGRSCPYPCDFIFRTNPGEDAILRTSMGALVEWKHPKTGVLICTDDDKNSADGGQFVGGNAAEYGVHLLDSIELSKTTDDVAPYVRRMVSQNPDVIFIESAGELPARVMQIARRLGFLGEFVGGACFNPGALIEAAGDAGKGAYSANIWHIDNGVEDNTEFVRAYRRRFASDPDTLAAQAYAGMLVLADAARRAHLSFTDIEADRLRLRAALEMTCLDTPLGNIRFTDEHDVDLDTFLVAMDGKRGHSLVTALPAG